ncbi:MAG: hypothetical protein ABFR02_03565 [Campylobacterota bacterium]
MNNVYVNLIIKHPSSILPDVRLEYANIKSSGKVYGEVKQPPFNSLTPVVGVESEDSEITFEGVYGGITVKF